MFAPLRLLYAARRDASPGVLGAAAVVAAVFAATPFLIPDVASTLGVSLGSAGLVSVAQVGTFAAAAFIGGRLLTARAPLVHASTVTLALANGLSALAPGLAALLAARALAGAAMGSLTWLAWADATRLRRGLGDVAAVGPIAAALTSPLLALVTTRGGFRATYAALGVSALVVLALPVRYDPISPVGRRVSPSRSNRVLLGALSLFTCAGSALFVFASAAGQQVAGVGVFATSIAFSLNALAGIVATRLTARPTTAGWWLTGTAVAALVVGVVASPPAFYAAMVVWGFTFWMGVPEVFRLLAARSRHPAERIGDAQALMALGRVAGPAIGGVVLGAGRFSALSVTAAAGLLLAALTVSAVEMGRLRLPPTPDRA